MRPSGKNRSATMPAPDSDVEGLGIEYDCEYDCEYDEEPGREQARCTGPSKRRPVICTFCREEKDDSRCKL